MIVKIISGFTDLIKTGKFFVGKCPFHNDKHHSFIVNPLKQKYSCFECGRAGDAYNFLNQYKIWEDTKELSSRDQD